MILQVSSKKTQGLLFFLYCPKKVKNVPLTKIIDLNMKNINVGEIKQESNFEILEQCYRLFQILFKLMQTNSLHEQINFN